MAPARPDKKIPHPRPRSRPTAQGPRSARCGRPAPCPSAASPSTPGPRPPGTRTSLPPWGWRRHCSAARRCSARQAPAHHPAPALPTQSRRQRHAGPWRRQSSGACERHAPARAAGATCSAQGYAPPGPVRRWSVPCCEPAEDRVRRLPALACPPAPLAIPILFRNRFPRQREFIKSFCTQAGCGHGHRDPAAVTALSGPAAKRGGPHTRTPGGPGVQQGKRRDGTAFACPITAHHSASCRRPPWTAPGPVVL